jgi:hypothetical protein
MMRTSDGDTFHKIKQLEPRYGYDTSKFNTLLGGNIGGRAVGGKNGSRRVGRPCGSTLDVEGGAYFGMEGGVEGGKNGSRRVGRPCKSA